MPDPIRIFIPIRAAAPDAASHPPPITALPTPLSMRVHTQSHLLADMAIAGSTLTPADIALLALRVRVMAEEIEDLEAAARRSRR